MKIEKEEFNKKIFSRINRLIDDYQLIKEEEKIAVALSGGKDSVLTLHALHDYQMNADFDFDLMIFIPISKALAFPAVYSGALF